MRNACGEVSYPVQHKRLSIPLDQMPLLSQSAAIIKAHAQHFVSNNHISVSISISTHFSISFQDLFHFKAFTMKLSILLSMLAGTAVVSAAADVFGAVRYILYARLDQQYLIFFVLKCTPEADCCFSTKGACQRQSSFAIERYYECGTIKLCPDYGVSLQACVSTFLFVPFVLLMICSENMFYSLLTSSLEGGLL